MEEIKVSMPFKKQPKDSLYCGQVFNRMFLDFYGKGKSFDQLVKEIKTYKRMGTYLPQLAVHLLKNGLKCKIISMNPHLFTLSNQGESQEIIAERFRQMHQHIQGRKAKKQRWFNCLLHCWKPMKKEHLLEPLRHYIEFIECGGIVVPEIPRARHIIEELAKGRPVGASITRNFLHQKSPILYDSHFTIIKGVNPKTREYIVNDPSFEGKGEERYPINTYHYAIDASSYAAPDNGSLLLVAA